MALSTDSGQADAAVRAAQREDSVLLVIDVQERLLPHIDDQANVLKFCQRIVQTASRLAVPIVCTEQYPKGLGPTVAPLKELLAGVEVREKTAFSCCGADGFVDSLRSLGRRQVVVIGIEAHVCVEQTVLDLLAAGFAIYVAADAVSSRRPLDRFVALDLMRQAGAVVTTTEAVMFQWLKVAGTSEFKDVSRLVREL